jgi:ribosomal RNA assembly protein
MDYSYEIKIPHERIAVLIGADGETKERIMAEANIKLDIDSEDGTVYMSGKESLDLFTAKQVVQAIARGFNPELALLLLKTDYALEFLNLNDFATQNHHGRLKGRVIGAQGKSQKTIEDLTECYLSVYGKTIGIIGQTEKASMARKAVEMLLEGSMHRTVYGMLEKWRRRRTPSL